MAVTQWTKEVDINVYDEDIRVYTIPNYDTSKNMYLIQVEILVNQDGKEFLGQTFTIPNCKEVVEIQDTTGTKVDNSLGVIYNQFDGPEARNFGRLKTIKIFSKPFEVIEEPAIRTYSDNTEQRYNAFVEKWNYLNKK